MLGWAGVLFLWYRSALPSLEAAELPNRRTALSALLASVTTLFRTQAIVLVVGVLVGVWIRKRSAAHRAIVTMAALGPLVAWKLLHVIMLRRGPVADLPDEGGYLGWFAGAGFAGSFKSVALGVASNAAKYLEQLGPYLIGNSSGDGSCRSPALVLLGGAVAGLRRYPFPGSALGGAVVILVGAALRDRLFLSALPFLGLAASVSFERLPAVRTRWFAPVLGLATGLVLLRQVTVHRAALGAFAERKPAPFYSPSHLLPLTSRYLASASRWVLANTSEQDHLLIDYPAAIYLYTGRKTVPANPAEGAVLTSAFEVPGRYLAHHILEDSVSVIVGNSGSPIIRDLEAVRNSACAHLGWFRNGNFPLRFRVSRDEECLSGF
jgi:hypothetical protein